MSTVQQNPTRGSEENELSPITLWKGVSCVNEIAERAVTPGWRTIGGQCTVVQEAPGSKPVGNPQFLKLPFQRR